MPQSRADVLELLAATAEMTDHHPETPVITMSMGALGAVSRLCGEAFGSAMTFANPGQASAPGQVSLLCWTACVSADLSIHSAPGERFAFRGRFLFYSVSISRTIF